MNRRNGCQVTISVERSVQQEWQVGLFLEEAGVLLIRSAMDCPPHKSNKINGAVMVTIVDFDLTELFLNFLPLKFSFYCLILDCSSLYSIELIIIIIIKMVSIYAHDSE